MEERRALFGLPFVRIAPFLAAGMLIAYFGGGVLCATVFAFAAAVLVFMAVKRRAAWLCAAGALLGLAWMTGYLEFYCKPILEFADKRVRAEFTVTEVLETTGENGQIIARMNLNGRIASVNLSAELLPEKGQSAVGVVSFGAHDEDRLLYNLANGILLSGEVEELLEVSSAKTARFDAFGVLRKRLSGAVAENISGDAGELALAMLFGMDERLSPVMTEKMRICGAAHYTAVSGAHFSVFAAVLLGIIPNDRKRLKTVISLLFAPAALMFFGASASVIRASVMFFIYSLAPFFMRKSQTLNTLCVAVTLIALVSPGTVLDAGFAMSVLGVFGAGVCGTEIGKKFCELLPKKLKSLSPVVTVFSVSVGAVSCTAPLSVALFKGVSLAGALVSVILMPLMTVGAFFAVLLGVTELTLLAAPIGLAMKLAAAIVGFFGGIRGLWLSLDFAGAWELAALFALFITFAAFGKMKTARLSAGCMAVLALFSMSMAMYVRENRSEVRFVGNSYTSAAVVFNKSEAAVLISGKGTGLAESISRCLREGGAVGISCIAAVDADYGGALAIRELSKLISIDAVYSNETAKKLLTDLNVIVVPENSVMSVSGVTLVGVGIAESEVNVDIAVYHGNLTKIPESTARAAVYFANRKISLPENAYNARREEVVIKLPKGRKIVTVINEV